MHQIRGPFVRPTLMLLCVVCAAGSRAEHSGHAHQSHDSAEHSLAGIFIDSRTHDATRNEDGVHMEPIASVLETLGAPEKITRRNDCEREYLWIKDGVRIEVATACIYQKVDGKDVLLGHGAYAVEVWGNAAKASVAGTGRGLALGDDFTKAKRLYGTRGEYGHYDTGAGTQDTHGLTFAEYVTYRWGDSVELDVDAGGDGRVDHIQLRADLE